jgi:hypothetical protein
MIEKSVCSETVFVKKNAISVNDTLRKMSRTTKRVLQIITNVIYCTFRVGFLFFATLRKVKALI